MDSQPDAFQEAHLGERPIRDLGLTIAGTLLEPVIAAFASKGYAENRARRLSRRS